MLMEKKFKFKSNAKWNINTQALFLSKRDVGETDRICTIYTLEGGKIKSIAKGVRKAHAKLSFCA
jgi:recombinational DNA repair protein (RecF pathway)